MFTVCLHFPHTLKALRFCRVDKLLCSSLELYPPYLRKHLLDLTKNEKIIIEITQTFTIKRPRKLKLEQQTKHLCKTVPSHVADRSRSGILGEQTREILRKGVHKGLWWLKDSTTHVCIRGYTAANVNGFFEALQVLLIQSHGAKIVHTGTIIVTDAIENPFLKKKPHNKIGWTGEMA